MNINYYQPLLLLSIEVPTCFNELEDRRTYIDTLEQYKHGINVPPVKHKFVSGCD